MKERTKWIVIGVSIALSIAITIILILASINPNKPEPYQHISFSRWLSSDANGYDIKHVDINRFIVDINSSKLLITDTSHGTYVVDASPSIVQTLTTISDDGTYTSRLITSLNWVNDQNIEYESIDTTNNISIWLYITLSISLVIVSLYGLYTYKGIRK